MAWSCSQLASTSWGGVGQRRGILTEAAASSRRRWAKGGGVELLLRKDDRGKLCHNQMRVGLLLRNSVSQRWKMYKEKRIRAYATTGEYLSGSSIAWKPGSILPHYGKLPIFNCFIVNIYLTCGSHQSTVAVPKCFLMIFNL